MNFKVGDGKTDFEVLRKSGNYYVDVMFENVPCYKCAQCGEVVYRG